MIRYRPFIEERQDADLGAYLSFGIRAIDEQGNIVKEIHDVSTRLAFAASLCKRCTINELDPIHLKDVIEDSIG